MLTLSELFLYFAKYVGKDAAMAAFTKDASSVPGYGGILKVIPTLKYTPINVSNYVFGADETVVSKRVATFNGTYLFVDFGNLRREEDNINRRQSVFTIAATIATPIANITDLNQIEIMLYQDMALSLLNELYDRMYKERNSVYWLKSFAKVEMVPFIAPELSSSQGWTMTFNLNYY